MNKSTANTILTIGNFLELSMSVPPRAVGYARFSQQLRQAPYSRHVIFILMQAPLALVKSLVQKLNV